MSVWYFHLWISLLFIALKLLVQQLEENSQQVNVIPDNKEHDQENFER